MTKQEELVTYVFESRGDALEREIRDWMEGSARFAGFVGTYRDKIRKKVRVTREPEGVLDLRGELEVAYRLVADRRFSLIYEPYASEKRRSADFAVTYRANLTFNVEVARIHAEESEAGPEKRVLRVLLSKLGQMQPGMANVLILLADTPRDNRQPARGASQPARGASQSARGTSQIDLGGLMQVVKTRVEARDPAFYADSGYGSPAGFYRDFLRLNAIMLREITGGQVPAGGQWWVNKQARPELDEKVMRLIWKLVAGK